MMTNRNFRERLPGIAVMFFSFLLSIKLICFVKLHAVNLLFSDHWTYLKPLFDDSGAWERFNYQHGPHRQGLGFLISGWLMQISNWNTNLDSYFIGVVLCFSNILLLLLFRTLRGKFIWSDILCPLLILSPIHYETILLAPNSSHSIIPLFLIIASCLGFIIKNQLYASMYLLLSGFLLVYTGFGLFAGLLLLSYLAAKALHKAIEKENTFFNCRIFFLSLAPPFAYFWSYNMQFATYDFSLEPPASIQYVEFICFLWAGVFQIRPPYAFRFGAILLLTLLVSTLFLFKEFYKTRDGKYLIPLYLIVSSLIYTIAVSTGRIQTGANFAQGSRYMSLPMLGIFGSYIFLNSISINWLKTSSSSILLIFSLNDVFLDKTHTEVLEGFQSMKRQFLVAYSPDKSLAQVQTDSGVLIPGATEEQFYFLQKRGLHFTLKSEDQQK